MQHAPHISSDLKHFLSAEERDQLAGHGLMREWAEGPTLGDRLRYAVLQLEGLPRQTQTVLRPRIRTSITLVLACLTAGLGLM
jgi:hypothetical protein